MAKILITGGTGTLGRTLVARGQHRFTVYSRGELAQAQMRERFPDSQYILGDVRDYERLQEAVAGHDLVIHAAALKRVPECEAQPAECFKTNVWGSLNVIRACHYHHIPCLGISSDKACRAITQYGASKLMMEKLFLAQHFPLVRYGNVVQSHGSVIPLWRTQAERGEITVTCPEMTRFWMSPLEAVQTIWDGVEGEGILVRASKSLSIRELAEIIVPGIPMRVIGLRSMEKMHEDLIHPDERVLRAGNYFRVTDAGESIRYSSDLAPRVTPSEFQHMLQEAESVE